MHPLQSLSHTHILPFLLLCIALAAAQKTIHNPSHLQQQQPQSFPLPQAATNDIDTHIATRLGHRIPLSVLPPHARRKPSHVLRNALYVIQSPHLLHAPQQDIPLPVSRAPPFTNSIHPRPTLVRNGKVLTDSLQALLYRESVDGKYALFHMPHGRVISARMGDTLQLRPVYTADNERGERYTVLLDAHSLREEEGEDNDDDVLIPPPGSTFSSEHGRNGPPRIRGVAKVKCEKRAYQKVVEVAIVFDNTLCAKYDNDFKLASFSLVTTILQASAPYEAESCASLRPVHIEGHCKNKKDPYAPLRKKRDLSAVLSGFAKVWKNSRAGVHRDMAVFFPGFEDRTGTAGIAWLGGACSSRIGYTVVEEEDTYVTAHEIGHLLNMDHTRLGIMRASVPRKKVMEFSSVSLGQMNRFLDAEKDSACIEPQSDVTPSPTPSVTPSPVTPSPSPSPVSPTPTPTASPSPNSVNPADTCDVSFTERSTYRDFLACDWKWLGDIIRAKVEVTSVQEFGYITITLATAGKQRTRGGIESHVLTKVEVIASMNSRVSKSDPLWYRREYDVGDGMEKDNVMLTPSQVRAKRRGVSCCFKRLYVHTNVVVTVTKTTKAGKKTTRKVNGRASFRSTIICDFCKTRSSIPMSPTRKCPKCRV